MDSSKIFFKNAADAPQARTVLPCGTRCAVRTLVVSVCVCLAVLYAHASSCRADNTADEADNRPLRLGFISLEAGNAIGPSSLRLRADGTLGFSIERETLTGVRGTWTRQKRHFAATVDFNLDRRTGFHYRLILDGYSVMDLYAGRAGLREYDLRDRLMQEIGFLFYTDSSVTRPPPEAVKDDER